MAEREMTRETLAYFKTCLGRLTPTSERRFGTLDAHHMLRHLRLTLEACLELVELPDRSIPVVRRMLFWTITSLITTWPGGRLKAPAFWTPPVETGFEEERTKLLEHMDRFVEALEKTPARRTLHPIFGWLTMREWSRLIALHFRHHFRQFGVA